MSKTAYKFSPEVRERAVRLVLGNEGQHGSRWQAIMKEHMPKSHQRHGGMTPEYALQPSIPHPLPGSCLPGKQREGDAFGTASVPAATWHLSVA